MTPSPKEIFNRAELLLGADGMERLASVRVILFGVGGVGSWCAEGLIRSGVTHLTLVDADCVAPSNINRQRMATVHTVGRSKVEVLREMLLDELLDGSGELLRGDDASVGVADGGNGRHAQDHGENQFDSFHGVKCL